MQSKCFLRYGEIDAIYLFVYRFTQLKLVCTRVYTRKQLFCLIFTDRNSLWLCRNLMFFFQSTACTERSEDDLCAIADGIEKQR